MYRNVSSLIKACDELNLPVWELMIRSEMKYERATRQEVWEKMKNQLHVMENAAHRGADGNGVHSPTGLTGGEAAKMRKYRESGRGLSGELILSAIQNSLATNEVNAAMGLICATPTAGSSGTIPGVLFSIDQRLHLTEDQKIQFLFTASAFGLVTANNAMIAGAVGGCQAEVGSASAMAAAAAVEVCGGTPGQAAEAFAIALSNLLGLVEIPCVKRNVVGSVNALACADMALAGLTNKIPADEVISAMKKIGEKMPVQLRETGLGGLAATPTGLKMKIRIFGEDMD